MSIEAMAQKPIEVILTRQLASYLAVPIFIVDPQGALVFFNEPAEQILGLRFEETGEMPVVEWASAFKPMDDDDRPLPPDRLPLVIAIAQRRAVHGDFWIRGVDGTRRRISTTAFPLIGLSQRCLGGVAIFWEARQ
jgi:PAS domain S-box-containing protein